MFYSYQILLLFVFIIFIALNFRNKALRAVVLIIFSAFLVFEVAAVYLTTKLIDYRFYNHINIESLYAHGFQFITQIALFIILYFVIVSLIYFTVERIHVSRLNRAKFIVPILASTLILLSMPNSVFGELFQVYEILNAKKLSFNKALAGVGISPNKYVAPDEVTALQGKNIIVISLESIEQGFLGPNFSKITPHLTSLTKEWTYYDQMLVGPGGSWTSGSLYKHQVGVPAFFKGQVNQIFQGTTDVKLTGLGHVLNKAGYNSRYLIGDATYSGVGDILTSYGIPVISYENSLGKYHKTDAGLNDYDLFKEAKLQINELKGSKKPFALFMSTINTHFPHGIFDVRMKKHVPRIKNNLEFSVLSADYLVNDFINYIKQEGLFKNTSIFIFPDHTLMGSDGPVIEKLSKSERKLYLLTNVSEDKLPKKTFDKLYQIDLPRMIISGAEIKSNAVFLADLIDADDVIGFLEKNKIKLTTLNNASVTKTDYKSGFDIKVQDNYLTINSNVGSVSVPITDKEANLAIDITFTDDMRYVSYAKSKLSDAFNLTRDDKPFSLLHLIINLKGGTIDKTYFGNKQMLGIYKKGQEVSYSKEDIGLIVDSNSSILSVPEIAKEKDAVLMAQGVHDTDSGFQYDPYVVSITSSEFVTSIKTNSVFRFKGEKYVLQRGLNLLTLNADGVFNIEQFDTYESGTAANRFLKRIENLIKNKLFWAVAVNDAVNNNYPGFKKKLTELNFKLLQTLKGRVAYIAYTDPTNTFHEYSSKTTLSYKIPSYIGTVANDNAKPITDVISVDEASRKNNSEANLYNKDQTRYIAHAGGVFKGKSYNFLEAMDYSYNKGFRLFELDILKTSDGLFVAAHDWKTWSDVTGYKGDLPPDRKVFLQQKIFNKYTPMDMDAINNWFEIHSDAVLITDKINEPIAFSDAFYDKNRLMMELFTWGAVKEGVAANIKSAMPTYDILAQIKGDKIDFLKKLGITDVAASRRIVNGHKKLIKKIVDSGIKIFAFHLNFDKGIDEVYVACNEREYFYGMYADKWDANATIDCSKL